MHKNMHVRICGSRGGAIPHGHPARASPFMLPIRSPSCSLFSRLQSATRNPKKPCKGPTINQLQTYRSPN